jgi:ribosomal protein S7
MIEIFRAVLLEEIKKIVGHKIEKMEYEIVRGTTGEKILRVFSYLPDGREEIVEIDDPYLVELAEGYSNSIISTTTAPLAIKYATCLAKMLYNTGAKKALEILKKRLENVPPEQRSIQLSRIIAAYEVALNLTPKTVKEYFGESLIEWLAVFTGKKPTNIEKALEEYLKREGVSPKDIVDFVNFLYNER